jgi:cytochrome c553
MDPYKDKLSDDEIKGLIGYMRAFKVTAPVRSLPLHPARRSTRKRALEAGFSVHYRKDYEL